MVIYNITQVSRELGISRQAIYDRIARGHVIPTVYDADGRPLFTDEEVSKMPGRWGFKWPDKVADKE